MVKANDKKAK